MAKKSNQDLFDAEKDTSAQGPVECLGMTFPNDEARRTCFLAKLKEKLTDSTFSKIEGFPVIVDPIV